MAMKREVLCLRIAVGVLALVVVALAIALGVSSNKDGGPTLPEKLKEGNATCSKSTVMPRDLKNPDVFDDLTHDEMIAVRDYLNSALGLKRFDNVIKSKNLASGYIYAIDLHLPKKAAALNFLDGNGPKPVREALVVVYRGDKSTPIIEEYVVSPLPKPSRHKLYKNPSYRRNPIPYHTKYVDSAEASVLHALLMQISEKAYKVLKESFGAGAHNCTKEDACLAPFEFAPRLNDSGQRTTLFGYFIYSEGFYMRPVCFLVTINHKSLDTSNWHLASAFYNGKQFNSIEELVSAYDNGEIEKVNVPLSSYTNYYSYRKRDSHSMPSTPQMGARMFEPEGKRYSVAGRKVKYMGWSFNFRSRVSTGLQLFDVKFRGQRIAYELALQEAFVIYAGTDILSTVANYYDVSWNMGDVSFELMPGVDCPETASFFDMDYFVNWYEPKRNRKSVCIFELNTGMPLRRHFTPDYVGGFKYYAGVPHFQLVIRQIATVWNYDYVIDYVFHLNGAIEVKAASTGYPQVMWYYNNEDDYGHKIFNYDFGNMHIHNFHFKVDVDVLGSTNRYETLDIGVETVDNVWFGGKKTQMRLNRTLRSTEKEALYRFNFDQPKMCLIYNNARNNSFGTKRGFVLKPIGMGKFVLPDNVSGANAASWTKYQVAVTKHKDGEQMSSSIYAQNDPFDPVLDFDDFVNDDESIVDEDLVAWVSLAVHHVPHSEDAPSTQTPYNTLNFFLYPYNYHDEDPSASSSDTVLATPEGESHNKVRIDRYGTSTTPQCHPNSYKVEFNGTSYV